MDSGRIFRCFWELVLWPFLLPFWGHFFNTNYSKKGIKTKHQNEQGYSMVSAKNKAGLFGKKYQPICLSFSGSRWYHFLIFSLRTFRFILWLACNFFLARFVCLSIKISKSNIMSLCHKWMFSPIVRMYYPVQGKVIKDKRSTCKKQERSGQMRICLVAVPVPKRDSFSPEGLLRTSPRKEKDRAKN